MVADDNDVIPFLRLLVVMDGCHCEFAVQMQLIIYAFICHGFVRRLYVDFQVEIMSGRPCLPVSDWNMNSSNRYFVPVTTYVMPR